MEQNQMRQIAERVIQNIEQMSLPKASHGEREDMIGEVEGTIQTMLIEMGYVRLVKPGAQ